MWVDRFIMVVLVVQVLCAAFFVWTILESLLGLPPIGWQAYELIQIGAALGLVLGIVMAGVALRRAHLRTARMEQKLRVASGAFLELMQDRFEEWGLTPAEMDVALFSIKGMSTAEIASLRQTSEGTVKAQTNAIYRKAGVSGRPQLLSLFIEDLMDGAVSPRQARIAEEPQAERSPAPVDASPPG
ncbi:MAG: helix-turn-helix transcriptional regulator [Alphaproteobacteria bacterium]|jgi:DNA-binding CsgD family transcriptional regulator|nr:helix-turn-helix transcriptional regulator [Alphaproteobacteria bacterium]